MKKLNIHEAKTYLSSFIPALLRGEKILLCRRNVPIAEIVGLPAAIKSSRPIGLDEAAFSVPDSFFEPLPEEFLRAFGTLK